MSEDNSRQFQELEERLRALKKRVDSEGGTKETEAAAHRPVAGMEIAGRVTADFIAGLLGGAGIGYLLDLLFGTKPLFLVVLMLLGFAAGMLNAYRTAKRMNERQQQSQDGQADQVEK